MRKFLAKVFGGKGKRAKAAADAAWIAAAEEQLRQIELIKGEEGRPEQLACWGLILRSPFKDWANATSWFGGAPVAPAGFKWPRSHTGVPLPFFAQIDLAALADVPETGAGPVGAPREGALLFFISETYECCWLSPDEVANGVRCAPPDDFASLREQDFFIDGPLFAKWPVDPHAFLDVKDVEPSFGALSADAPSDWITNWGVAKVDADLTIISLERELRHAAEWVADARKRAERNKEFPEKFTPQIQKIHADKDAHYGYTLDKAPAVLASLKAWSAKAASMPPTAPVPAQELAAHFAPRIDLAEGMARYAPKFLLPGNLSEVWHKIRSTVTDPSDQSAWRALPPAYHPLVEKMVTGWRGHRLLGLEPPPEHNYLDLRGKVNLLTIATDELTNMQTEHSYAISVWHSADSLAKGDLNGGVCFHASTG